MELNVLMFSERTNCIPPPSDTWRKACGNYPPHVPFNEVTPLHSTSVVFSLFSVSKSLYFQMACTRFKQKTSLETLTVIFFGDKCPITLIPFKLTGLCVPQSVWELILVLDTWVWEGWGEQRSSEQMWNPGAIKPLHQGTCGLGTFYMCFLLFFSAKVIVLGGAFLWAFLIEDIWCLSWKENQRGETNLILNDPCDVTVDGTVIQ